MILKLALREIRANRRFSIAFGLNLAIGLFGFVLLSAFHASIQKSFQDRSQALLTADLAVSARRALTEAELVSLNKIVSEQAPPNFQTTHVVEMYTMVSSGQSSRLVEIMAIEEKYPLYGDIQLQSGNLVQSDTPREIVASPSAWASAELAIQMGLKAQDKVRVGDLTFNVADTIERDASAGWRGFSFAPRMYIGLAQLKKTGLIRKGSTVAHSHFFRFDQTVNLDQLIKSLNQVLTDPGIRVVSHQNAGEQMTRTLSYLSDYLGLVALVGLFLAALGSAYLFQSFLARRLREIATLISLGLSHSRAIYAYLTQALILGFVAAAGAVGAAILTLPQVSRLVGRMLNTPFPLKIELLNILPTLTLALLGGIAVSVLICLPLALRIRELKPTLLFQESGTPSLHWSRKATLGTLPVLIAGYFLSVWQAHSWKTGSLFFIGLFASGVLLSVLSSWILGALGKVTLPSGPMLRIALRYLSRNRLSSVSAFLAIGLGSLLIHLLPQLQRSIESEIENPEVSSVPSLFLFDIQEDQVTPLNTLLKESGVEVMQNSPLIRARLDSINGEPFEKPLTLDQATTREEEQEARSRNRGFNLTYRAGLSESEKLVDGKEFSGAFDPTAPNAIAEISVEMRFAERLKVKLGDVLRFSIEGVDIEGKIVSFRKVQWTSFQPNFFVVFQPGVLDDAPKTFLASIKKISHTERVQVQTAIVNKFNNISIIDVTQVVQKMLQAFQQMSYALQLMALLAVFAGLVVLFSIANHQAKNRLDEIQLLKVLGASTSDVSRVFLVEFGTIGLLSSSLGVGISMLLSYALSAQLFDQSWSFSGSLTLGTIIAVTLLTIGTTQFAAFRSLKQKPRSLLG